jgi:hypothetical protein
MPGFVIENEEIGAKYALSYIVSMYICHSVEMVFLKKIYSPELSRRTYRYQTSRRKEQRHGPNHLGLRGLLFGNEAAYLTSTS